MDKKPCPTGRGWVEWDQIVGERLCNRCFARFPLEHFSSEDRELCGNNPDEVIRAYQELTFALENEYEWSGDGNGASERLLHCLKLMGEIQFLLRQMWEAEGVQVTMPE